MKQSSFQPTAAQKGSILVAVVCIALGLIYCIMTAMLPKAAIGMPNAPKVFPYALGTILVALGVVLFIQQYLAVKQNIPAEEKREQKFSLNFHTKQIILTIANGSLYALLFGRLGYVLSTMVFLFLELLLFNGKRRWKMALMISLIFSLLVYILFNKLLGVYLPMMPVVGF